MACGWALTLNSLTSAWALKSSGLNQGDKSQLLKVRAINKIANNQVKRWRAIDWNRSICYTIALPFMEAPPLRNHYELSHNALRLIYLGVLTNGILTISGVMLSLLHIKSSSAGHFDNYAALIVGISFIYLASLLLSGKRAAWAVCIALYIYLVAHNLVRIAIFVPHHKLLPWVLVFNSLLSVAVLCGLIIYRDSFNVKSQLSSATQAAKRAAIVLLVALLYGTVGFQIFDTRDFREEITLLHGVHYTVDQFGLTTDRDATAHTKRGEVFLNSLSLVSSAAVLYVIISFFSPIKARLIDQSHQRLLLEQLLRKYPGSSEDFFKLWPHDKLYFLDHSGQAGLAYKVESGVALIVGDPAGEPVSFPRLLEAFFDFCRLNDWQPAFIHVEGKHNQLYEKFDFNAQKIGEEAVIDVASFVARTSKNKYFRHISNKFNKQNYSCELLQPPHSAAVLARLKVISDSWLSGPGRAERGFMLGYFNKDYIQQCEIMVAKDAAGTIQAFLNRIPSYDPNEANMDFLRHYRSSLGNINDYLMLNFLDYLNNLGIARFNLGLSPLAGLEKQSKDRSIINSTLQFIYDNAGRLYSFDGLRRFKSKYEPNWRSRFICYKGGLPGFAKTASALNTAMKIKPVR